MKNTNEVHVQETQEMQALKQWDTPSIKQFSLNDALSTFSNVGVDNVVYS